MGADRDDVLESFRLNGKVAVVTGATKNIGLEISRCFADAGAILVMVARGVELLEQRAEEISRTGTEVTTVAADISTADGCAAVIEAVHRRYEQADVLVNNAHATGNTHEVDPTEIPEDAWDITIATNIRAPYRLSAGLARRMKAGRGGSIINLLSGSGFLPNPGLLPYGTTKAGLWMLTRYLAVYCAPEVRVNALCPGLIMSETGGPAPGRRVREIFEPQIPMQRAGHPTEVAPAALYLASDAASYTTGTVLFVNGGRPW